MQYSLKCICVYICLTLSMPNINEVILRAQRTFSGVGLQSVVLSDMHPNEEYSLQIRCGAQMNFWKWGDWSKQFYFKTSTTGKVFTCSSIVSELCHFITHSILTGYLCLCHLSVPDAPDVWVWMNRDNTGQVVWKVIFSCYIFLICKTKTTFINLKKKKTQINTTYNNL